MRVQVITEGDFFHIGLPPTPASIVPTTLGSMNYDVLGNILEQGNVFRLFKGAEIGVLEGVTSDYLLSRFPKLELHCVDPYLSYESHESSRTAEDMKEFEQKAHKRLSRHGERVNFIKKPSLAASEFIADDSLDFVFIDALHTYEAVLEDLHAWSPKVRPGGIVAGHDYSWNGIKKAVEDFIEPLQIPAFHTPSISDVWFFVNP